MLMESISRFHKHSGHNLFYTRTLAWSAASSWKRPLAFRVTGHYRGDWGWFIIQKRAEEGKHSDDDAAAVPHHAGAAGLP